MKTLPVFLKVQNKPCLLVGEGEVATRKKNLLIKAGAVIQAVGSDFSEEHLAGVVLVVAASDNPALNQRVSHAAQARNIPVNVVDTPELCTFIFPSTVERGDITVAVSSGGAVPVLTRLLRARLETLLPPSLTEFAAFAASWRARIKQHIPNAQQRLRFWDALLQKQLIGAASDLNTDFSDEGMQQQLEDFAAAAQRACVFVVGAGPGDPDLLTFKALRCLQACDAVVFDAAVDMRVVELARRDAHKITITTQDDVFAVLATLAEKNQAIVYLKAGDPLSHRDVPLLLARLQAEAIAYGVVAGIIDQAGWL